MTHARTEQHSALSRFFRNPDSGDVVVMQPPNAPLLVWLAATVLRWVLSPDGVVGTTLAVVGTVSLVVWSLLEIARGDSPFRRALGAVVLVGTILGRFFR
jgi:hypothetical protein